MEIDWNRRLFMPVRRATARLADGAVLGMLWLMVSVQIAARWLIGYYPSRWQRQRAQSTIEIVIGMAVLAALALVVWKLIGPVVVTKANGIVTDLNTSGTSATGGG